MNSCWLRAIFLVSKRSVTLRFSGGSVMVHCFVPLITIDVLWRRRKDKDCSACGTLAVIEPIELGHSTRSTVQDCFAHSHCTEWHTLPQHTLEHCFEYCQLTLDLTRPSSFSFSCNQAVSIATTFLFIVSYSFTCKAAADFTKLIVFHTCLTVLKASLD